MRDKKEELDKPGGEERRRHKRFAVDVMGIGGKMLFARRVEILDISIGGILLRMDRGLEIKNEYALKLLNKDKSIFLRGIVVRSLKTGKRKFPSGKIIPVYDVGIKFTNLSNEKLSQLLKYIDVHHRGGYNRDAVHCLSGLRLNIRFRIDFPEKAYLSCPEEYSVKELSLCGMLIESGYPLEIEKRITMEIFPPKVQSINFSGRVVTCTPVSIKESKHYDIGIEFVEIPEKNTERLSAFILSLLTS